MAKQELKIEEPQKKISDCNTEFVSKTVDKIKDLIVSDEIQFSIDLLRGLNEGREEICLGILEGVRKDHQGALEYPNWIDYEPERMLVLYVALSMLRNCKKAKKLFKEITYIDLSTANIKELPKELYDLGSVEKISLEHNELKDLPDGIGSFTNLSTIELGYNKFEGLPTVLCEVSNLESLGLQGNKFKKNEKFWSDLNKLVNLKFLDVSENSFGAFPIDLSPLQSLESIKLSSTCLKKEKLVKMLEGLASLPQLSELDISSCEIAKIPDEISALENLKSINLSYNKFKEFPLKLNNNRLESSWMESCSCRTRK